MTKIVNKEEGKIHIFLEVWYISITFSGKM